MLASVSDRPPDEDLLNPALVYEPKYDGIRALVAIEPGHPAARARIWSRLGNEKTDQFPEVVRGLKDFGRRLRAPVLLDGEIVALDERGEPAGFQRLQGRMHLTGSRDIERESKRQRAAFIAFDILRDGADDLRPLSLADRKARLERVFGASGSDEVRHGEFAAGDGRRLFAQAEAEGWEGLVAKAADAPYESGRRSPRWRKLKLLQQEEFLIGGWTTPRDTRQHFGALLLGMPERDPQAVDDGKTREAGDDAGRRGKRRGAGRSSRSGPAESSGTRLRYVGHVGTGFSGRELEKLHRLLKERATDVCPFAMKPPSNESAHWVRPDLVAQVKFTEWTNEGVLRHPVYLGLRDDVKTPRVEVGPGSRPAEAARERGAPASEGATSRSGKGAKTGQGRGARRGRAAGPRRASAGERAALEALADHLTELEAARKDATVPLPDGSTIELTNLAKVFWPAEGLTKGDLLRFYLRVSPWILPAVADRPLVMKRYPNGVKGKAFYQQRAPDVVPRGIRVEQFPDDDEPEGLMPRIVGGSLQTLLYMTQLAAISQDPWFSRVETPGEADYAALDLDPMPGVGFRQVLDVACWVHDELEALGVPAVPKTSGSSGLHIYIPLPRGTPYESGMLLCQIVATIVAMKHPKQATVERSVGKRGRTVYVDYLQNIEGKTLATAYSARASEFGGVSTPLAWDEVAHGLDPADFTMRTVLPRFEQVGDLWAPVIEGPPVDLHGVLEKLAASAG